MVRINLLPPEIGERRKFEQQFTYVVAAGLLLLVILGLAWAFLQWQVAQKSDVLQTNRETASKVQAQAEAFKVFELKEQDFAARQAIAAAALAGRVDWSRIANEISLVLPSDVWLNSIEAEEEDGLTLIGMAIDSETDVPDLGHKAVAKTLVRLADLALLENVWLTSSEKTLDSETEATLIEFEITSGVVKPAAPATTNSSVPAPPSQTAQ